MSMMRSPSPTTQRVTARILLVDDQVMLRDTLRIELEEDGYAVFTASTAAEALDVAASEPIDLILTDLVMPERDGMWLLHEIGRVRPAAKVIMVTGYGSADSAVEALQAGAFDYLEKPLEAERLKAKVRKALRVKRLEELRQHAEDESIRRTQELSVLYSVSQTVTQSLDISEILEISLGKVLEVMDLAGAAMFLLDEQGEHLQVAHAAGLRRQERRRLARLNPSDGSLRRILEGGHLVVPDVRQAKRVGQLFGDGPYQSCLAVPVSHRGEAIGVLGVLSRRGHVLSEEDVHLLASIGNQLGTAIANARLFEQQRRQAEQLRLIHRVGREILSSLHEQETLDMILQGATKTLPVDKAAVVYRDEGKSPRGYAVVAALNMAGETVRSLQQDIDDWMAAWIPEWEQQELGPIHVQDARADSRVHPALVQEEVSSLLAVPLVLKGEVAGVLMLCNCATAAAFDPDDRSTAVIYGDLAAVAIKNSRTFEGVERRRYEEQGELLELSTQLLGTLDPDRVAEIVCEWVARATHSDGVLVLLAEPGSDRVSVRARHGWPEDAAVASLIGGPDSIAGFALEQKEAVLSPDLRAEHRWDVPEFVLDLGFRAAMAAPFVMNDDVLGALVITFREPRWFTEDDSRGFLLVADRAAAAVHQAFLYERVRQREEELARVNEHLRVAYGQLRRHATVIEQANALTAASASSMDIDRLYRNVAEYALGITQSSVAVLTGRAAEGGERVVSAGPGHLPASFPRDQLLSAVAAAKAPVWWPESGPSPTDGTPPVLAVPLMDGTTVRGMLMVMAKDEAAFTDEDAKLLQTLANQAVIAERTIRLYGDLEETYDTTLEALVAALDARDRETEHHSQRVAAMSLAIGRRLGIEEGSQEWVDTYRGAVLHDVGKIGVADAILRKPDRLTPSEWAEMRRHPEYAYHMLKDVKFLTGALEVVYAHHERYDGKGYPRGLKSEDIPLGSRIFAVADAFDAMTSDRPYRKAMSWAEALQEIRRHTGTQFDPKVVEAFEEVYRDLMSGKLQVHPVSSRDLGVA
jgi:response regulator RpfG family c-di-GMP phosphodiesterase